MGVKSVLYPTLRYLAVSAFAAFCDGLSAALAMTTIKLVIAIVLDHDIKLFMEEADILGMALIAGTIVALPCALFGSAVLMLVHIFNPMSNDPIVWTFFGGFIAIIFVLFAGALALSIVILIAGTVGGYAGNMAWNFLRHLDSRTSVMADNKQ